MNLTMLELIDELVRNRIDEELARLQLNTMDFTLCREAVQESIAKIEHQIRKEALL